MILSLKTDGLCPGPLPKEMTWSQDWADDSISLTKSNQRESKQCRPSRARPTAHGSWQGGQGAGRARALVQEPSASTDARIYLITSRSMFISLARFLLRTVLMFTT